MTLDATGRLVQWGGAADEGDGAEALVAVAAVVTQCRAGTTLDGSDLS